jgi:ABC-type molybdate transport system substrate-binding protein
MLKKSIAVLAVSTLGLTGCAATEESLTLYSGRKENLVQPLLDQFTEDTGIEVEVRYAGTSETAALILEPRRMCFWVLEEQLWELSAEAEPLLKSIKRFWIWFQLNFAQWTMTGSEQVVEHESWFITKKTSHRSHPA